MKKEAKKPFYGQGTKRELVLRYQTENVSAQELSALHGIGGSNSVMNWVKKAGILPKKVQTSMKKKDKTVVEAQKSQRLTRQRRYEQNRISELEAEVDEAKKRLEIYRTALDLQNQDLAENFLKKIGGESSDKFTKTD
jgi:transposase-like protein